MAQPSRTQMSRAATARPPIGGDAMGTLHVNTAALSAEYELMWATAAVLGADWNENIRLQMSQRGFVPVMASELPDEAPPLLPGETRKDTDVIRRGGCVLMKRPKRHGLAEREELAQQNADALRSVNRDFEHGIQNAEGLERLKDGGVTERIERRGRAAFPE